MASVRIEPAIAERIAFATHQNAVPILRDLEVFNDGSGSLKDLTLELTAEPSYCRPKTWHLDRLAGGTSVHFHDLDVVLDGGGLHELTEAVRAELVFRLRDATGLLAEARREIRFLARDEWGGIEWMPELLAAFVQPNDPAVETLLKAASNVLRRAGKDAGLEGYQSRQRRRIWEIAGAIWSAVGEMGLDYAMPPSSFETAGQKVRGPSQIKENGRATCLDLVLLFCAAFEQAGLNPLIVMTEGHAVAGVWLQPEEFRSVTLDAPDALRKRIDVSEIIVFETTFVTQRPLPAFSWAAESAKELLGPDREASFRMIVDVRRARMQRIFPLPRVGEPLASADAEKVEDPEEAAKVELEEPPELPDFDIELPQEPDQSEPSRLDRWQRKLLDLTKRNRLLNFRASKRALWLVAPDPGRLEDLLAQGNRISLSPLPELTHEDGGRSDQSYRRMRHERIDEALARDALERKEVMVPLPREELDVRLVELYRQAQAALQEGGANILYLAVGFLAWKPTPRDRVKYKAPLILIPVSLERKSVRGGVKMVLHEDEPRFNPTLLEMLRQDFDLAIPGVEPLPRDEHGIDVQGVWDRARHAVVDQEGFEVTTEVVLGTFSFAKYLMWKDLVERTEALKENPVVRHLLETPREAYRSEIAFPAVEQLDLDELKARWRRGVEAWWPRGAIIRYQVRNALRPYIAEGAPGSTPDPENDLDPLIRMRDIRVELTACDDLVVDTGSLYCGLDTDTDSLDSALEIADRLRQATALLAPDSERLASLRNRIQPLLGESNELLAETAHVGRSCYHLLETAQTLTESLEAFESLAGGSTDVLMSDEEADWLAELVEGLKNIEASAPRLRSWCAWQSARESAVAMALQPLIQMLESGEIAPGETPEAFRLGYARWWSASVIDSDDILRTFVSAEHELSIEKFRRLDDQFAEITRQTIVVGDPRQLPPTSFFDRQDEEADEDVDVEGDLESILDECLGANMPTLYLRWHYRSKHESLIAFSNHRYYSGHLVTFPSNATEERAVRLIKVAGNYDKGGARTNVQEAKMLVADIVGKLTDPSFVATEQSIGVVTFNAEQQRLIEDLLDEERRKSPDLEPFFTNEAAEPVMVKNLESVQGDERDVMYFSITYGPDPAGKVSMNFGPMNRDGGERRLNVAITRARSELRVFASLTGDQIDLSRTGAAGVRDLKQFLEFAERGMRALGEVAARSQGDFESPFERAVGAALAKQGWEIHPKIGASSYRVDLGVVHPDLPGRYLAGVECDGATYQSAATARDRDKLREAVLKPLGWEIIRAWSTEWWSDATGAADKLGKQLQAVLAKDRETHRVPDPMVEASASAEARSTGSEEAGDAIDPPTEAVSVENREEQQPAREEPADAPTPASPGSSHAPSSGAEDNDTSLAVPSSEEGGADTLPPAQPERFYEESYTPRLVEIITRIIEACEPVRQGNLATLVARHHGFDRTGRRIQERVDTIARQHFKAVQEGQETFFWKSEPKEVLSFRDRVPFLGKRDLEDIALPELVGLAQEIRNAGDREAVVRAMADRLGLRRLTTRARRKLEKALACSEGESG